jgi:hypothetical protein
MFSPRTDMPIGVSFFYLTHWGYYLTTLYFLFGTFFSMHRLGWIGGEHSPVWTNIKRALVVTYECAFSLECLIVPAYWVLAKQIGAKYHEYNTMQLISTIHMHGISIVWLFVDNIMNDMPFYRGHFVYPMGVALIYMPWNMLYVFTTGNTVYTFMTWTNWQSYVTILISWPFIFGMFFVGLGFARLTEYATKRIMG